MREQLAATGHILLVATVVFLAGIAVTVQLLKVDEALEIARRVK